LLSSLISTTVTNVAPVPALQRANSPRDFPSRTTPSGCNSQTGVPNAGQSPSTPDGWSSGPPNQTVRLAYLEAYRAEPQASRDYLPCFFSFPPPVAMFAPIFGRLSWKECLWATHVLKPSSPSSPWMRGAPHVGFSLFIRPISFRTSCEIVGRPTRRGRDRHFQNSR